MMKQLRIVVQHTIEQVVIIHIPEDELKELTYEDAIANCPFEECQPSLVEITEIVDATVDGKEHYFQ